MAAAALAGCLAAAAAPLQARAAARPARPPTVLVLGDSLSAEYGLARGTGWVALLADRLAREGPPVDVVNASISGEATSGGLARLPALLQAHHPAVVVIELGANDALRGLPLSMTEANLKAMVVQAQRAGAKAVVVGMAVPPNYGRRYADDFQALFGRVARAEHAALVPFLLHGVADVPDSRALFQADGLHPRAEAHPRILANVWPVLRPLLR